MPHPHTMEILLSAPLRRALRSTSDRPRPTRVGPTKASFLFPGRAAGEPTRVGRGALIGRAGFSVFDDSFQSILVNFL